MQAGDTLWGIVREYTGLRELSLELENMRGRIENQDIAFLGNLKLTTGNVENYHFIKRLPQIYYIELMGPADMKNAAPNPSLLPNACFIEYYDEQIVFDVGGE